MKYTSVLITGSAGFIGSNFVNLMLKNTKSKLVLIDSLTYAANPDIWKSFNDSRITKYKMSINDKTMASILKKHKIDCIVNFAAETHVDNSIATPTIFYETNVLGTVNLLNAILAVNDKIRFHHISTDEVYGELSLNSSEKFHTSSPLDPSSPYSSSKAAADFIVQAYGRTYKLDYSISRCSNNYGPNQHYEKLIPNSVISILKNKPITIYGDGQNVRDWIFVEDHNLAVLKILSSKTTQRIFNIGSCNEIPNIEIAKLICKIMKVDFEKNIKFVKDRKGHDRRYAICPSSMENIGWKPKTKFVDGITFTINSLIKNYKK